MLPMLSKLLPTLVPPYFCTTQGTLSSSELARSCASGEAEREVAVGVEEEVEAILAREGSISMIDVALD